ncbi:hypothetical protein PV11_02032 [Exophiala sideris]|uniref:Uncharacterized protein n=1 Tax=Exophiala sideris TaxID=1016849 RepID=A0A0D1WCD8_9EURO|nr:hypothetical protein PV11_02032 [Exophiala sideris]
MSYFYPDLPPFVVQQVTCVYPLADRYAGLQRILYYGLLAACFVTQRHGWMNKVFLGASYSYAASAAIHAFILMAKQSPVSAGEWVDIPLVSNATYNSTVMSALEAEYPRLVTNSKEVWIQPASMDLDIDALLAITVTGFLVVLPMQCWSSAVRGNRLRYLLVSIWSAIMFAGAVCSLILWPRLFYTQPQYSFCAPPATYLSLNENMQNPGWNPKVWHGNWTSTIWSIFTDTDTLTELGDFCFNPCFNTTSALRAPSRLTATMQMKDAGRLTDVHSTWDYLVHQEYKRQLVYVAISVTVACNVFLLMLTAMPGITNIPVSQPKRLWKERQAIWGGIMDHARNAFSISASRSAWISRARFCLDLLILCVLVSAMVASPVVLILFIVWIEGFTGKDLMGQPYFAVGQWGTLVQFAFVLVAAVVVRFRYHFAARSDIENEIRRTEGQLKKLYGMLNDKSGIGAGEAGQVHVQPEKHV